MDRESNRGIGHVHNDVDVLERFQCARVQLFAEGVHRLPVYEGVVACLLTVMGLLAVLGVRYPVRLLPLLVFESAWKLLWLGTVALPLAVGGDLEAGTREVLFNCSFVVVILAVTPWDHVWRTYVRAPGDRWR